MDPKPQFHHQHTSVTNPELSETETKGASPEPPRNVGNSLPSENDGRGEGRTLQSALAVWWKTACANHRTYDTFLLFASIVMLAWPWIFWGVVFAKGGIQMNDHVARLARDHPPYVSFVVTLIGNIVALIVDVLFSLTVVRFAQEWILVADKVTVFDVSLLSAFRYQSWPWTRKDIKPIFGRRRWLGVVLVGVCIGAFAFVPSSTTTLLTPAPFNKTVELNGTELDFSSMTSECLQFLGGNPLNRTCDWKTISGFGYTDCLSTDQLADFLESGRINMLSLLPNRSESLALTQFGNSSGLRFLGPSRGVLPVGPDSPVPVLGALQYSPISGARARGAVLAYNYTLALQGLSSDVTCAYETRSPIGFSISDGHNNNNILGLESNGTCPEGQADFLNSYNVTVFTSANSLNGLGYWVCKSRPDPQRELSYYVYLRGRSNYTEYVGNITCTISTSLAVFPVAYQPQFSGFSVQGPLSITPTMSPESTEFLLMGLGALLMLSQNVVDNTFIQSIFNAAARNFDLVSPDPSPQYLRLYEAMIQGMLEYENAYIRLIYSMTDNPPASCLRTVNGTANLQVFGWSAKLVHIGFLMPMTLINLSSLVLLIVVLRMAKGQAYDFDPTEMRRLLAAKASKGQQSGGWDGEIEFPDPHRESEEYVK